MAEAPADRLVGQTLDGGWQVSERLPRHDEDTGGAFSVGYIAVRGADQAFVKAIDLRRSLVTDFGIATTQVLLGGQLSEAQLLERCAAAGLDRIISPIGSGVWADPKDPSATPVPYVLTEWADGGDLRRLLSTGDGVELAFGLGALHDLAVATQQIHGERISHHDMKPSNALVVAERTKLGDFGHAVDHGQTSLGRSRVGTLGYAPPEVLYCTDSPTWDDCRAVDLYLLGSMVSATFAGGVPMTLMWTSILDDEAQPGHYRGEFRHVLPYVVDAFGSALEFIRPRLEAFEDGERLLALIRQLCWPDPTRRGMEPERMGYQDQFSLRRVISELDLMAKRARIRPHDRAAS